ncbi:aldo/keto reductase [Pelagibius litoralis]|uniref:Aldo/keto reductase n=1 Tax=Pelagibius litoralis TaxID=374515 RepID=A0A967KBX7_9PROT|nr:aldo/keto reductase [Pelagibius litoralis]NIA70589.1 aldo/keto reductase [Pelagibius litoralis]
MRCKRIGTTDLKVTEVSLGCGSIGNLYREVSDGAAEELLHYAWGRGIRYFDTAPRYGSGRSEQRLGRFLRGKDRDSYVVSTKVGRVLTPGKQLAEANGFVNPLPNDVHYDYSGDGIEASFEQSCDALGGERIDILYVHDIGVDTHGDENGRHMDALLGSGLGKLHDLKVKGRIQAFGLGVNENAVCLEVMRHSKIDVVLLAGRLTLLDRSAEAALVGACAEAGTSLVLGGVFNSGILATGAVEGATYDYGPAPRDVLDRVDALQTKAEGCGLTLATAALHYAARHPAAASVLIGTGKAATLARNMDALETPCPEGFTALFA